MSTPLAVVILLLGLAVPGAAFAAGRGLNVAEAVSLIGADHWQDNLVISGFGTKVAIIDQGFEDYTLAAAAGEVPQFVSSLNLAGGVLEGTTDHGTLVAEIVSDLAPQASLYVIKVLNTGDLSSVQAFLSTHGIDIVVMSLTSTGGCYWDQTCSGNQSINTSRLLGTFWAVNAGNHRTGHREGLDLAGTATTFDFVSGGTGLPISGSIDARLVLNWDSTRPAPRFMMWAYATR